MTRYEWLTGQDAVNALQGLVVSQGWAPLNPLTTKARVAFDEDGLIIGFLILQLHPIVGPEWVIPDQRNGIIRKALESDMREFAQGSQIRGYLVIAESPVTERTCKQSGMAKVPWPVYADISHEAVV